MGKTAEFFFDVGSPASYLAWTQLPALCRDAGATLDYRPMLLGGVFQATGNQSPVTVAAKGRWMGSDLARHAARYRVPFAFNPHFPINTLFLMRAITGVQLHAPERLDAFVAAVFHAMWAEPVDLNRPEVVQATLEAAGFATADVTAWANDAATKARLREVTEGAVARGVFGAPTVFVGDEMHFGQDRLDFVREALARA